MKTAKVEGFYTDMAMPCESEDYRPFTDPNINDLRYISALPSIGVIPTDTFAARGGSYNIYVTPGGRLRTRPPVIAATQIGSTGANTILSDKRIDRVWTYLTLPDATGVSTSWYLLSVYDFATLRWKMYHAKINQAGSLTAFTNLRNINDSQAPHVVNFSRGLAFVKGFPASGDKLGTIIFDCSSGTPAYRLWGLLPPTVPARIKGWVGKLTAAISHTDTSWSVASVVAPPGTPFDATIGYETVQVTAVAGAGPYPRTDTLTVTRGINGTTPLAAGLYSVVIWRDWAASDHTVRLYYFWEYTYAYEMADGQISSTVDRERNPDLLPSRTGPFNDLIPKVQLPGHADTSNIPYIRMFRTTDGGGTPFSLEKITNTGAGTITYEDDSFGTGGSSSTFKDPVPDTKLGTADPAPDLTINSPPPTVNLPLVVGTDTPSINTSKMVRFARRFWYAIDHVVKYSGEEEINLGIPECCWPPENEFVYDSSVVSMESTSTACYILTATGTHIITGTNRDSFASNQISDNTPMNPYTGRLASTSFLDRVAFITSDGRVVVITGTDLDVISESIGGIIPGGYKPQMEFFSDRERQWLCVLTPYSHAGEDSHLFIYDWSRSQNERRDFWLPPMSGKWTSIHANRNSSTLTLGYYERTFVPDGFGGTRLSGSTGLGEMFFAGTGVARDDIIVNGAWATGSIPSRALIGPVKNPAGNLVNVHAVPALTTCFHQAIVDYEDFGASKNLGLTVYYDTSDFSQPGQPLSPKPPSRRAKSVGYTTLEFNAHQVTKDYAIAVERGQIPDYNSWEVHRIGLLTAPEAGV